MDSVPQVRYLGYLKGLPGSSGPQCALGSTPRGRPALPDLWHLVGRIASPQDRIRLMTEESLCLIRAWEDSVISRAVPFGWGGLRHRCSAIQKIPCTVSDSTNLPRELPPPENGLRTSQVQGIRFPTIHQVIKLVLELWPLSSRQARCFQLGTGTRLPVGRPYQIHRC